MNHPEKLPQEPRDPSAYFEELKKFIDNQHPPSPEECRAGRCEEVASMVKDFFNSKGIKCEIGEGEVEIGPSHYLEHRINLIPAENDVWIIDLTSKQIPRLKNSDWMMRKIPNGDVKKFLEENYHWWFSNKTNDHR